MHYTDSRCGSEKAKSGLALMQHCSFTQDFELCK